MFKFRLESRDSQLWFDIVLIIVARATCRQLSGGSKYCAWVWRLLRSVLACKTTAPDKNDVR